MKLNHGGNFIRHPILKYAGGDKTLLLDIDEDKWSFFELVGILKDDANCTGDFKLWWTGVHDISIKELALDSDALELENFALSNNIEVLVYVEKINDGGVVVSKGDVEHLMMGTKVLGMKLLGSKLLLVSLILVILTLMKVVLKVGLRKIMKVLFLKIVKRREQLGLMMVLIVRMNI